ncbi:MAG: inorganic phosphate transporter [Pseudomonadota bacterium]
MDPTILVFLLGGLFLGWSLGANDAANVFGTAVGTGMVRFAIAAVVCSLFVILGAVVSGAGAAHTLGKLGAINTVAGAGMAAFSAALTVYWMTRLRLPVSTSQAIVGAIIGWNFFTGSPTDLNSLIKIVATWVACPLLAAFFGAAIYKGTVYVVNWARLHLFRLDAYTRVALILAGAFGSYSLGANNIANVMGVFVASNPFTSFAAEGFFSFSATQQLFLLGGVAIAVGVFTYSKRVMMTVGSDLMPLSPVGAWVVVVAHSIVLFLFASQGLEHWLASSGLPTIPLVPVSSSQAVVGALVGIGLLRGGRGIRWRVLGNIASGWMTTPVIACLVCFVALFFLQNVFNQQVYRDSPYALSEPVMAHLAQDENLPAGVIALQGQSFPRLAELREALAEIEELELELHNEIIEIAKVDNVTIAVERLHELRDTTLSGEMISAVHGLAGQRFTHRWQLDNALAEANPVWRNLPDSTVNKLYNKKLAEQRGEVFQIFAEP